MINKQSPLPIYHQIEEMIKTQISRGELSDNETIPSEREYAERFEISRMTVRHALNNLVREGYLYRQKGKGTFISPRKIEQPLQGLTSFTEDMLKRGYKPGNKLLSFQKMLATQEVASKLDITTEDLVFEIERIRLADDTPMAIEKTYVPVSIAPNLNELIIKKSIYDYIENELHYTIQNATQQIEAAIARESETSLLHIKNGDPVLMISRISHLQSGLPFEYVKSIYRGDRYTFVHNMDRS